MIAYRPEGYRPFPRIAAIAAAIILRSEDSSPGRDGVSASFDRQPGGFVVFSAVNFNDRIEAAGFAGLAWSADLGQHLRQDFLPAAAGVHGHDENDFAQIKDVFDRPDRDRWAQRHAGL